MTFEGQCFEHFLGRSGQYTQAFLVQRISPHKVYAGRTRCSVGSCAVSINRPHHLFHRRNVVAALLDPTYVKADFAAPSQTEAAVVMADVLNGFGPAVLLSLSLWHLLAIRRIPLQNRGLRAESQIALRPHARRNGGLLPSIRRNGYSEKKVTSFAT